MRLCRTISLSIKVCRSCHRPMPITALTCPRCGQYDLVAIRCQVDKRDLKEYYQTFPKR
jgi:ribosomal protein L40E